MANSLHSSNPVVQKALNAARARNGSSSPWGFFVGEMVVIKKDPAKRKHRIKQIVAGDIILEDIDTRFDASELDTANYAGSYKGSNATRAQSAAAARNAAESSHFKLFQGMAKAAVDEILYEAEGELRVLTEKAKKCAEAANAQGEAKAYNDIIRVLALLKDAVRKHHSDCLRTIG